MSNLHAKTLQSLALLLVAVSTAPAQTIEGPASITVQPGRLGTITIKTDADEAQYEVLSKEFDSFREQTSASTQLTIRVLVPAFLPDGRPTPPGHKGWVIVSGVKDGKLIRMYKCEVIAEGVIPPSPKPPTPVPPEPVPPEPKPPEPVPPAPVDPLVKAVSEAAANDGMAKSDLAKVAAAAKDAGMLVLKGQTAQRAHDMVKVSLSKSPPLGISLHTVLNDMTGKVFNDLLKNPTEVVDEAKAEAIRAPFVRLAKALEEAAK